MGVCRYLWVQYGVYKGCGDRGYDGEQQGDHMIVMYKWMIVYWWIGIRYFGAIFFDVSSLLIKPY